DRQPGAEDGPRCPPDGATLHHSLRALHWTAQPTIRGGDWQGFRPVRRELTEPAETVPGLGLVRHAALALGEGLVVGIPAGGVGLEPARRAVQDLDQAGSGRLSP